MAEQVPVVGNVLTLIERRDWDRLRQALHPDVHWTTALEEDLHGPDAVIALLHTDPPPSAPSYHESLDGQVVRWIDKPG